MADDLLHDGPASGGIRPAVRDDIDRIAVLWMAITEHHAALDPLFRMRPGAAPEIHRLLDAVLRDPDAAIFVYEEEAERPLQGMIIVRVDRAPPILVEVERAEITDLGVRSSARRRGIGRALAGRARDWVSGRGVERIEVRVASANSEGQAFWRALGFGDLMDVLQKRL